MYRFIVFLLICFIKSGLADTTYVSGDISGAVVWDTAGMPYILTGDVTVSTGDTLTIMPGVDIRAMPGQDSTSGGYDGNLVEIIVRDSGCLYARGTADDSIRFSSSAQVPAIRDWYGIRIFGAGTGILDFCRISDAYYGISGSYNSHPSGVVVKHCAFYGCSMAVSLSLMNGYTFWHIDSCMVWMTESFSIYVGSMDNVQISHCRIYTNDRDGIYCTNTENAAGDTGIVICDNIITGNDFTRRAGINIYDSNPLVTRNTVINTGIGVYLNTSDEAIVMEPEISFNAIDSCHEGVAVWGNAHPRIHFNDLEGAMYMGIYNLTPDRQDGRFNWWGPEVTAEMSDETYPAEISVISDSLDNPDRGFVDYACYLHEKPGVHPVIYSADTVIAIPGSLFGYRALAADRSGSVTLSLLSVPGWLTVAGDSAYGTVPPGTGDTLMVVVADNGTEQDTLQVSILTMTTSLAEDAPDTRSVPDGSILLQFPLHGETFVRAMADRGIIRLYGMNGKTAWDASAKNSSGILASGWYGAVTEKQSRAVLVPVLLMR